MKVKMTAVMTLRVIVMMIKLVVMNVEICQRVSVMTEVTGVMTLRLVVKTDLIVEIESRSLKLAEILVDCSVWMLMGYIPKLSPDYLQTDHPTLLDLQVSGYWNHHLWL